MKLINKFEQALNHMLIKLSELVIRLLPRPFQRLLELFTSLPHRLQSFMRKLRKDFPGYCQLVLHKLKELSNIQRITTGLRETYQEAMIRYHAKKAQSGKIKKMILTPFLMVGQWLQGLSPVQILLLLAFTSASVLSVIGIGFSGQKIMGSYNKAQRLPASAEDVPYERPGYYKEEQRQLNFVSLRLPIYFGGVNDLHSVDIDFTATLSNRFSRQVLEKKEFQLRDHLLNNIEPSIASYPLLDEGKEIIRQKLISEINIFLKEHQIEGEVVDLKITYVLAN